MKEEKFENGKSYSVGCGFGSIKVIKVTAKTILYSYEGKNRRAKKQAVSNDELYREYIKLPPVRRPGSIWTGFIHTVFACNEEIH